MNLLPYEKLKLKSALTPDELVKRLSAILEPQRSFNAKIFGPRAQKQYEGEIRGNSFQIHKLINYRNSFLPRISGIIKSAETGSEIIIGLRLHYFVMAFMCFWLGIVGMVALIIIFKILFSGKLSQFSSKSLPSLIPVGMFVFGIVLVTSSFNYEARISKTDLIKLFEAEIQ